jgi:hypothetical protein
MSKKLCVLLAFPLQSSGLENLYLPPAQNRGDHGSGDELVVMSLPTEPSHLRGQKNWRLFFSFDGNARGLSSFDDGARNKFQICCRSVLPGTPRRAFSHVFATSSVACSSAAVDNVARGGGPRVRLRAVLAATRLAERRPARRNQCRQRVRCARASRHAYISHHCGPCVCARNERKCTPEAPCHSSFHQERL